ncbi:hypothetical protein GCM10007160_17210 [Litchfieldella qijiaojingensis]|uniref:Type I secretion C-terminal target domain-containing protein n=1 Tax=Litchfieldella qijiaojingensis TaxID=980347 RepID=A0ABQ2YNN1_9GAMM|nr:retention module-containing protein [Halomonas qijiaojingensis]GGX90318.1 hypothetical protein GCM10007160_17210 [Halomonas qijiaojingensis]
MSIATVLSITGQAWARDSEGNLRELSPGDVLQEGETLVTSGNGSVQLDFGDGLEPALIGSGQQVAMTPEVDAQAPVDVADSSVLDEDIEALLAAIDEGDGDLLELLDATAAGAGGGGGESGGHDFVRLARITESVDPLAFEFGTAQTAESTDTEGDSLAAAATDAAATDEEQGAEQPPLSGEVTVILDDVNTQNVSNVPVFGTTTNISLGSSITIVVTDQNGNSVTTTTTANDDGSYQTEIGLGQLIDGPLTVEASTTDQTGSTVTANDTAGKDTVSEATISIDTIAGDDVVNGDEATQTITITGSVGGDAGEGDSVTLTVGDQEFTGTVDADGHYAIDVPGELLAENGQVEASVDGSDEAGNTFEATNSRDYSVDTGAEATISIDTIAGDDVVNGDEASQTLTVTGSITGDAGAGDSVTLTVGDQEFTGTVDADGNYAIDVPGSVLAENGQIEASVGGSDEAGNTFEATNSRDYSVDTGAEATISIDTIAGDDVVNGDEASQTLTVTGSITGDAGAGDSVTLTVGDQEFTGTVDADGNYAIDVPGSVLAENGQIEASVGGSDEAGNTFEATNSRDYSVDTGAEATISIDTIAGDDVVNAAEAGDDITVTGSVTGDAGEGDTVALTVGDETFTGTVDADGHYAIDVPGSVLAENGQVEASVDGSDEAGNPYRAESVREYAVDTETDASISIDTIAGDDVVNAEEAGQPVTITGSVGGDAGEGDSVTLTVGDQEFTGTVDADGHYAIDVPGSVLADNGQVDASISGEDEAGNPFSADTTRSYNVAGPEITGLNLGEADVVVDEQHLLNGSNPNSAELVKTGTFGVSAVSGIASITVAGEEILVDALLALDSGAAAIEVSTAEGNVVRITEYQGDAHGGTVGYEFELAGTLTHSDGNGRNSSDEEGVSISVKDQLGQDASSEIEVEVLDDVPDFGAPADATISVIDGEFEGNLDLTVGADSKGAQIANVSLQSDENDWVQVTYDDAGTQNTAYLTSGGVNLQYVFDTESQQLIAYKVTEGPKNPVFRIDVNTESYSIEVLQPLDPVAVDFTADLSGSQGGGVNNDFHIDGSNLDIRFTSTGGSVNWSTNGIGVDNNLIESGKALIANFNQTLTELSFEMGKDGAPSWEAFNEGVSVGSGTGTHLNVGTGFDEVHFYGADGGDQYNVSGFSGALLDADQAYTLPVEIEAVDGDGDSTSAGFQVDFELEDTVDTAPKTPNISLTVTPEESSGGDSAEIIKVNGGSGVAGGFDVQDGQIVKVGDGVRVWLTKGDTAPEIANPGSENAGVIAHYERGNHGVDGEYSDIFVVHSQSGWFYSQSDWDHEELRGLDSVHGNRTNENAPDAHGDYIFVVQEEGYEYQAGWSTNNNADTHVNTLDGVWVGYTNESGSGSLIGQVSNNIEGVIYGDGSFDGPDVNAPNVEEVVEGDSGGQAFLVDISAALADANGSEELSDVTLSGIPDGVTLEGQGVTGPDSNGNWQISNPDGGNIDGLQIAMTVPADTSAFDIEASVSTISQEGASSATAVEQYGIVVGSSAEDTLVGNGTGDLLYGGAGTDTLIGGAGDDDMYGGLGADTFAWNLGDQGAAGNAAVDEVMDFNADEGDNLELSDLLQEHDSDSDISDYLHASDDGEGGTLIHVSTNGGFAAGYDAAAEDQTIQLKGVQYDADLIQDMIGSGQLTIDQ